MLEAITLDGSNVSAEIDAYLHHLTWGYDGVFKYGNNLDAEIVTNNLIKIKDGLLINQGRFMRIVPGSYEEIAIENGLTGVNRTDLIVAHFETDGITETFDIRVIKGTNDAGEPEYTTGHTFTGGTVNELPLYAVNIEGINITSIDRKFKYIQSQKETNDALIALQERMPFFLQNDADGLLDDLDPNREE